MTHSKSYKAGPLNPSLKYALVAFYFDILKSQ